MNETSGDCSTLELAAFLRREAATWAENFGQEWTELRLAAEAIETLYGHLRAVMERGHLTGWSCRPVSMAGGTLTSGDGEVIFDGEAFFVDMDPAAYFAADAYLGGPDSDSSSSG